MDDRRFQKLSLKPLSRLGVDQTFEQLSVQDKYNRRIKIFKSNCRIAPDAASYFNLAIPFPSEIYLFFFCFSPKEVLNFIFTGGSSGSLIRKYSPSTILFLRLKKRLYTHYEGYLGY